MASDNGIYTTKGSIFAKFTPLEKEGDIIVGKGINNYRGDRGHVFSRNGSVYASEINQSDLRVPRGRVLSDKLEGVDITSGIGIEFGSITGQRGKWIEVRGVWNPSDSVGIEERRDLKADQQDKRDQRTRSRGEVNYAERDLRNYFHSIAQRASEITMKRVLDEGGLESPEGLAIFYKYLLLAQGSLRDQKRLNEERELRAKTMRYAQLRKADKSLEREIELKTRGDGVYAYRSVEGGTRIRVANVEFDVKSDIEVPAGQRYFFRVRKGRKKEGFQPIPKGSVLPQEAIITRAKEAGLELEV